MKPNSARFLLAAGVLLVAPVALRPPSHGWANAMARAATRKARGELVGKVVSGASIKERRLQVKTGRIEWTLNVPVDRLMASLPGGRSC